MNVNDIKEKTANFNYSLACANGRETDCLLESEAPAWLDQIDDALYVDADENYEATHFFVLDHNTWEYVEFDCDILDEPEYKLHK
jgi:hypothetical protein